MIFFFSPESQVEQKYVTCALQGVEGVNLCIMLSYIQTAFMSGFGKDSSCRAFALDFFRRLEI